jgi:hypothetical protein
MNNSDPDGNAAHAWHVFWRASVGQNLLADSSLSGRIRARLLDAHERDGRELLYYLLTPTEIHLLTVLSAGESAGDLARGVGNVIARWVRDVGGAPGPVFMDRFHCRQIADAEALRREIRMLAWRPVALGLSSTATHFRHGALRIILGLNRAEGFNAGPLLSLFGASVPDARRALRARLAARPSAQEVLQWELACGLALASGFVGPMGKMTRQVRGPAATLVAASDSKCIDSALKLLERWVEVKLGLRDGRGIALRKGPSGARARALVAIVAVRLKLCSAASVARYFKRSKATMSEQMTASRRRPEDHFLLNIPLRQVVAEAISLAPTSHMSATL